MNKNINKFKRISFLLTLFTCIMTIILNGVVANIHQDIQDFQVSIEDSWKDFTRANLNNLRTDLETAVNTNNINPNDDDELSAWIINHINHSLIKDNDSEYLKNISIINIGYSTVDENINMEMSIRSSDIDSKLKDQILYTCDKSFSLKDKTNTDIESELNKIALNISEENTNYSYEYVKAILIQNFFVKDKVLLSTTDNADYDIDKSSYEIIDGDNKLWVESVLIPSGSTGFNAEPAFKNNKDNINYKKLIVSVSLDSNVIMQPYKNHLLYLNRLLFLASSLIVVILLILIIFLCIKFNSILYKYNVGGDTNAEYNNRSICTFIDSVLRVNGVRIKQVWSEFRKGHK